MIEQTTFEKFPTTLQQAYEQMKKPRLTANSDILNALQQIQARISNLETIQAVKSMPKTNGSTKYAGALAFGFRHVVQPEEAAMFRRQQIPQRYWT